jgi:DNA replicative helicase MCM subunit Mcm2 (Cdc46/Mcm family)
MTKKTLWDLIKLSLPMGREKRHAMQQATKYLDEQDLHQLKYYLKLDRTFAQTQSFGTTKDLIPDKEWVFFKTHIQDDELKKFLDRVNKDICTKSKEESFMAFAPNALNSISSLIAPNIIGMDGAKRAAAAQLFAVEPMHILLIGDPGTGKTDILRGASKIAPIGSMGLGSGTSGAGLSAMAKGDTIIKGLLPMADGGIACIDELNLMKSKDAAALYNAMEKGFVTYDKGGKHEQLSAKVRVLATANPKGDTFIGKSVESLRNQIPFDDALLSRFHVIFIVRKPTDEEFEQITKQIVQNHTESGVANLKLGAGDIDFLKQYIEYAGKVDVKLDSMHEQKIVEFIKSIKSDERKFLQEVGPRTVVGVIRVVKSIARSELAQAVDEDHLQKGFEIIKESLYVRKPDAGVEEKVNAKGKIIRPVKNKS